MATKIILKKSSVVGQAPSNAALEPGELAINLADRTLYSKDTGDTVFSLGTDLAAIATTKADTAVDVFVYDTSKDSDGGAWRKRTQNTSWYNETLNTSTRGSRREFPAVAVIVAETSKVTIYDGDDPSLPMWMVFEAAGGLAFDSNVLAEADIRTVSAVNGQISIVQAEQTNRGGVRAVYFISDTARLYYSTTQFGLYYQGGLSERNDGNTYPQDVSSPILVDRDINDVAMTVLPDAPIDPATGLPKNTIPVGTAAGLSVIRNDGIVADSASTAPVLSVATTPQGVWWSTATTLLFATWEDVAAGDGFGDVVGSTTAGSQEIDLRTAPTKISASVGEIIVSGASGLQVVVPDYSDLSKSLSNFTATDFSTGWTRNPKGIFLSDTDDTDLVGGDFAVNGTFDTNTDWTLSNATISGGSVSWTTNATVEQISTVTLKKGMIIRVGFEITARTSGFVYPLVAGKIQDTSQRGDVPAIYSFDVVIDEVVDQNIGIVSGNSPSHTVDNVTFEVLDADRSVNANALTVNGTVTRSPVATGADLVAYSGFSASNYLEQPYNSDLDFGTGDFCVMGWVNGSGRQALLHRSQPASAGGFLVEVSPDNDLFVYLGAGTSFFLRLSTGAVPINTWSFITVTRTSGVLSSYINGNLAATDGGSDSGASFPNNGDEVLRLGLRNASVFPADNMALWRISATAPTAEQIAKIYEDEKFLFQENAQATLYGSSDAVTALAHDPVTDLLHVSTSVGRSDFQGLRRVSNTTDAHTSLSAFNGLIVGGS